MDMSALAIYRIGFLVVIVLILLDVIFGILAAINQRTFLWQKMYEFVPKDVLPCVLGLATFILFVYFTVPLIPGVPAPIVSGIISVVAIVMVCVFLVHSIVNSIMEVFAPPAKA